MPTQEASGAVDRHAMPLRDLLARAVDSPGFLIPSTGCDVDIRQVTDNSQEVRPGACFVALRGTKVDGAEFAAQAVKQGAIAIITDAELPDDPGVPVIRVPDARRALARMAAVHSGLADMSWRDRAPLPSGPRLRTVAITGTNGKSTSCFMTRSVIHGAGHPCALLGTIQYDLLSRTIDAPMTTPPATRLIEYLAEAGRSGATHAVMEASSHALEQRRTDGVRFDVGVFTNLTGDHLDYHITMEAYRLAKRRLFDLLDADATAVVNVDDPAGESMLEACRARKIRLGLSPHAEMYARMRSIDAQGSRFDIIHEGATVPIHLKLVGRHNVQNALCAAAAARAFGIEWSDIAAGLESVDCVRGRLEHVRLPAPAACPFTVLVDYAHTDDALQNVLSALRPLAPKKLIVMFGCGGDRDKLKRPRMAQVAVRWADRIIVTSDNPRSEAPADIIEQILEGFSPADRDKVLVQSDRRKAIAEAIHAADDGDVVVLAGKGHETYQEIRGQRTHFDDVEEATALLAERFGEARPCGRTKEA